MFIYNNQTLGTIQISINSDMDKQIVVYLYHEMLLRKRKNLIIDTSMGASHHNYAEWKNQTPLPKKGTYCIFIYIKIEKIQTIVTESRLVVAQEQVGRQKRVITKGHEKIFRGM